MIFFENFEELESLKIFLIKILLGKIFHIKINNYVKLRQFKIIWEYLYSMFFFKNKRIEIDRYSNFFRLFASAES